MPKREGMIAQITRSSYRFTLALLAAALLTLAVPWAYDPATAAPQAPNFGPIIDGYAAYDGQDECRPKPKPGVVAFRDMVLDAYPSTGAGSIGRACHIGGRSEHKEGRAWDWGVNAANETQLKKAKNLLNWLLATDKHGHRHALARRTGIMYIVWNRRMWNTWDRGWETYCVQQGGACRDPDSGSAVHPHTDHMHFSFSWRGARKNTTFWNPQDSFKN
jgi:hypothetical protein